MKKDNNANLIKDLVPQIALIINFLFAISVNKINDRGHI